MGDFAKLIREVFLSRPKISQNTYAKSLFRCHCLLVSNNELQSGVYIPTHFEMEDVPDFFAFETYAAPIC